MKYTNGPWAWQKFGPHRLLTAQHSSREIIIGALAESEEHVPAYPAMNKGGMLDDIDPEHPNAKLIAAAPDLYEALMEAKKTIKALHGDAAWDIYDAHSPEMKNINTALNLIEKQ